LMILSGAKGTMVNSVQISCELGQIELEGHRPPMTIVGRTLPSFRAFDTSPRAGGFVDQRFLTGINPQELFFHTMAGREGLIDTAVKTSRSGYLQRCIVKHLEGLVAQYDSTVRDHDGSVIQFRYGEDGMDVCKSTFMNSEQFDFLADNVEVLRSRVVPADVDENIKKWRKKYGDQCTGKVYKSGFVEFSKEYRGTPKEKLQKMWFELSDDERNEYHRKAGKGRPADVEERCIVKHLEGLVAQYDSTVRDHDGSVIQFRYGEDGMDVCKSTFMNSEQFDFLADNGLIDTAVKTSRSGYLQRCIVKHLEGLVAQYDSTVRDHDGSVIQFRYGEDGMDVCKSTFMNSEQFDFLADNVEVLRSRVVPADIKKWRKKYGDQCTGKVYKSGFVEFSKEYRGTPKEKLQKMWFELSDDERNEYHRKAGKGRPADVEEKMNSNRSLGALPQKLLDDIDEYMNQKSTASLDAPSEIFRRSLYWKGMRCRVDPGENVGLLAAQSIGEPSTQMTLNTFHFAGRGEMNVTLGIPRLREILMTESSHIKTPSAEVCCTTLSFLLDLIG
uniref:DNA-directed RNA polymerase n=1 Tax=Gongylonema pulchrum TaxID=637853 RepID=A0A183E081_9BILA